MKEFIQDDIEHLKNDFLAISYETYNNKFNGEHTAKERRDIFEFMSFLISVPERYNCAFYKFLIGRTELPNVVACILFGSMNKLKGCNLSEKYGQLVYELKYSPKSLNMLKSICGLCNIKLLEEKGLFGKPKVKLIFPQNFMEYVRSEYSKLPDKEPQKQICTDETYGRFISWWSEVREEEISNNEILFGAYQFMCLYNEVCNGGFGQFWDFAEDNKWNLNQMRNAFEKLLPEKQFELFCKALEAHEHGLDSERFNADFDYAEIERQVLPEIANLVIGVIN